MDEKTEREVIKKIDSMALTLNKILLAAEDTNRYLKQIGNLLLQQVPLGQSPTQKDG